MNNRKKEMKEKYKQTKPQMGLMIIRNIKDNKCYIEGVKDLKSVMNSARFKLESGNHPNTELQKRWNEIGPSFFKLEILDYLNYNKDEMKADYKDDLQALRAMWMEKIARSGMEFYE